MPKSSVVVTISRIDTVTGTKKDNLLKKRTATDKTTPGTYTGKQEAMYDDEYEIVDVPTSQQVETLLLKQVVAADDFDLAAVITAVNKLGLVAKRG